MGGRELAGIRISRTPLSCESTSRCRRTRVLAGSEVLQANGTDDSRSGRRIPGVADPVFQRPSVRHGRATGARDCARLGSFDAVHRDSTNVLSLTVHHFPVFRGVVTHGFADIGLQLDQHPKRHPHDQPLPPDFTLRWVSSLRGALCGKQEACERDYG